MAIRNLLFISFIFSVSLLACKHEGKQRDAAVVTLTSADSASFIPRDSANKMIGSYLNSIGASVSDTGLRSLSIDVAKLKAYINSDPTITKLKISFAQKLSYINSGHQNQPCGYNRDGITLVITAYDNNGNYKYFGNGLVLDNAAPCPASCPPGQAAGPYLTFIAEK